VEIYDGDRRGYVVSDSLRGKKGNSRI